jgi:hypothetical protein
MAGCRGILRHAEDVVANGSRCGDEKTTSAAESVRKLSAGAERLKEAKEPHEGTTGGAAAALQIIMTEHAVAQRNSQQLR